MVTFVLALRALQVQVVDHKQWSDESVTAMIRPELLATTRGELLDCRGRVIAEDESCFDACVDYDALADVPDAAWLRQTALGRLAARGDWKSLSKSAKAEQIQSEQQQVLTDLDTTWKLLARDGGMTLEQLDDLRHSIVTRVESRGESVTNIRFAAAMQQQKQKQQPTKWYERIFNDGEGEELNRQDYRVDLAEAHEPHPILRAIGNDERNKLSLLSEKFAWLKVIPSVQRFYPYHEVAAQLIGRESAVTRELMSDDPFKDDALRKYWPSDLVGTSGLEHLCEPLLRGSRGRIERVFGETTREISNTAPVSGQNVQTTIDIALQHDIEDAFNHLKLIYDTNHLENADQMAMPGAAVVIDIPSGEVRALASMPTYDANDFDEDYDKLSRDVINRPLLNRATQLAYEPGSTVKPMVGLGAITSGINQLDETIECTGYLVIGGKRISPGYRCWTVKMHTEAAAHHNTYPNPHPTGFLTFADGLERSCNVFFETTANKMGINLLCDWLSKFGLGRPTGIGVSESIGQLPDPQSVATMRGDIRLGILWRAGIGQGEVRATPLQIANEAATVARGGTWLRPRLVSADGMTRGIHPVDGPDRVDLHLDPAAVREAREGMYNVVNSPSGTGRVLRTDRSFKVAGKTGSAQASLMTIPDHPDPGEFEKRINYGTDAKPNWRILLMPGTHEAPNPEAPWYRYMGTHQDERSHAWFMGYVPADNPKYAIAVLVEYGGSGGVMAGQVFDRVLDALVKHGYLPN